ncbi:MarR family winged helix-turn-helix transcriptional regulator [Microbispora catharanthi]|uniref:MarR family transcriptional regulator n=1 Tax=Microbispora catharanthi TaxID=1712871 RepID=A0A5N6B3B2_9ACTN|nr:helix-turn-helix domain-containing protein [Microbispora catharanthi]KAB8174518.1 MarR family transcriptional regulator [Microbispora catharanthi]
MNGVDLFLLGRTLMKIGEEAMPVGDISPSRTTQAASVRTVLVVVADLRTHPETSVGEIAARTGLPQSAVSGAVARLKEAGAVVTAPDPADRRRVVIRQAGQSARVEAVRAAGVEGPLAAALGTDDPAQVAEVVAALEFLARRLAPGSDPRRP